MKLINMLFFISMFVILGLIGFGCGDSMIVSTNTSVETKPNIPTYLPDIVLHTKGGMLYVDDYRIKSVSGESCAISFNSWTNSNNTDYVSQITVLGWNENVQEWITIYNLAGDEQINGFHSNCYINEWSEIKIYARLFTEFQTLDEATLKLSEIEIN